MAKRKKALPSFKFTTIDGEEIARANASQEDGQRAVDAYYREHGQYPSSIENGVFTNQLPGKEIALKPDKRDNPQADRPVRGSQAAATDQSDSDEEDFPHAVVFRLSQGADADADNPPIHEHEKSFYPLEVERRFGFERPDFVRREDWNIKISENMQKNSFET